MLESPTKTHTYEHPLLVPTGDETRLALFLETRRAATGGNLAPIEHLRWTVSVDGKHYAGWEVISYESDTDLENHARQWLSEHRAV